METMDSLRGYTNTQISPLLAKPIKPLLKLGFVPKPNLHYTCVSETHQTFAKVGFRP